MSTSNKMDLIKTVLSSASSLAIASVLSAGVYAQTVEENEVTFSDLNHNQVNIVPLPDASADVTANGETTNYDSEKMLHFKDGITFQVGTKVFTGTNDPAIRDNIHGLDVSETIDAQDGNDIINASLGPDNILASGSWDTVRFDTSSKCDTPVVLDLFDMNHEGACAEGDVYFGVEAFVLPKNQNNTIMADEYVTVQVTGGNLNDKALYGGVNTDYKVSKSATDGSLTVEGPEKQRYLSLEEIWFANGTYEAAPDKFFIERSVDGSRNLFGTDGDDNFRPDNINAIMYSSAGCDHYDGRNDSWSTVSYLNADGVGELEINGENHNNNPDGGVDSSCDTYEGVQAYIGSRNQKTYFVSGSDNEQFTSNHEGGFAVYDGNIADYTIVKTNETTLTVADKRNGDKTDGRDILKGVDFIAFNDGYYKDGVTGQYQAGITLNPEDFPDDYLGVAVYYGTHLDDNFTANAIKKLADERVEGVLTPAFGSAGSALGEGTAVTVFHKSQIGDVKRSFNIPLNGTLKDPVGYMVAAIMPVGSNNEVKPYHERNLAAADRYKAEIPIFANKHPRLSNNSNEALNNTQEAGCYVKSEYPDKFQEMKNNADLNTLSNAYVSMFLSTSACAKHEEANDAYIEAKQSTAIEP